VGAQFGQPPLFHDGHPVGVVGRVQPVGDGQHRPARQDGRKSAFGVAGGGRVEQGGGLVKNDGVRVREHHPGQGSPGRAG
jgi:hypothetical protein